MNIHIHTHVQIFQVVEFEIRPGALITGKLSQLQVNYVALLIKNINCIFLYFTETLHTSE